MTTSVSGLPIASEISQVAGLSSIASSSSSLVPRLAGLVVLASVFLLGAGAVVFLSFRGTEVKVPNLVGKQESEADRLLSDSGLRFKIRNRTTDEKIQANLISEQVPEAGATVKAGQVVGVTVSTGIEAKKQEETAVVKPVVAPRPKPSATPKPDATVEETPDKPADAAESSSAKAPAEKSEDSEKGEKPAPATSAPKAPKAGDKPSSAPDSGESTTPARPTPARTVVKKPALAASPKPSVKPPASSTPKKPVIH